MFCKHRESGCLKEMKYKDLDNHLEKHCIFAACPYKEYGCDEVVVKEELEEHMKGCVFTPVDCQHCGKKIADGRMKVSHHLSVNLFPIISMFGYSKALQSKKVSVNFWSFSFIYMGY